MQINGPPYDAFYYGAKQSASPVAPIKNEKRTKKTNTFVGHVTAFHGGSSRTVWLQTTRPLSDLLGTVEATD